tara:strand:+ start:319 stop:1263 length:945 start_codon:yes stop_codon:yes gene_type:complete
MDVNSSVTSIAFTKDLIISGHRKMVKLGEIIGFGKGNYHYTNLHPAITCLVSKTEDNYILLNKKDIRTNGLLEQYNASTMVEVFEISSEDDVDKITFLTGELIPHQTSNTKFSDLFTKVVRHKKYQKWIQTHFTSKETRANSQVSFNLANFLEMLGKNAPAKITLDRIINNVKKAKKGVNPNSESTAPTQVAPPLERKGHLEKAEPETAPLQLTDNSKFEEHTSDTTLDSLIQHSEALMSDKEMQELWDTHSNSKYTYSKIIELLKSDEDTKTAKIERFTSRLNEHKDIPTTLPKFTQTLEQYLDSLSSQHSDG